jgi:hypothetical protein
VRQVDNFVGSVSQELKQLRPDLSVSVAVFPLKRSERLYRLQQNWEEWGQNNWVDMIFLMTYALDTGNLEERTASLYEPGTAGASLIIPGIRLLKVPDAVTLDQIQLLRNMPTPGFALFATENLTPELETILQRTQGTTKPATPLPHRQPLESASLRFLALKQEWGFMLSTDQLAMQGRNLETWTVAVDSLAAAFEQLAQAPNQANLRSVQTKLQRFRRDYGTWMAQQMKIQPLQVQAWQSRLDTLERLLTYGEKNLPQENP